MGTIRSRALHACAVASTIAGAVAPLAHAGVLATNGVAQRELISNAVGVTHCQVEERLPRGTHALRLSLQANGSRGPVVAVVALVDERAIGGGARAAGWSGSSVAVPLRPAPHRSVVVTLCMTAAPEAEVAVLGSNEIAPPSPGQPGGPRVQVAYLDRMPPSGPAPASRPLEIARALLRVLVG